MENKYNIEIYQGGKWIAIFNVCFDKVCADGMLISCLRVDPKGQYKIVEKKD